MLTKHILATKGGEVVTVASSDSVGHAIATLRSHGIGAVIVSDDDGATVAGILSERDIVRAIADDGPGALDREVSTVMTAEVFTSDPDATIEDLMTVMTERRIRHIPVLVEGRLVGVVSIGDVVKHRVGELSQEAQTLVEYVQSGR